MIFNLILPSSSEPGPEPPAIITREITVPTSGYWSSQSAGDAIRVKAVVTQNYNTSTNTSSLSIKLYACATGSFAGLTGSHIILGNGSIYIDGVQAYSFPFPASTSNPGDNDYVIFNGANWAPFKKGSNNQDLTITKTKTHNSGGAASITFAITFSIYGNTSYNFSFDNSATVDLTI